MGMTGAEAARASVSEPEVRYRCESRPMAAPHAGTNVEAASKRRRRRHHKVAGFGFNDIISPTSAPTAPDTPVPDRRTRVHRLDTRPDNVHCGPVFREYEATYLIGVAAAMADEDPAQGRRGHRRPSTYSFLTLYTMGFCQWAPLGRSPISRWMSAAGGAVYRKNHAIAEFLPGAPPQPQQAATGSRRLVRT